MTEVVNEKKAAPKTKLVNGATKKAGARKTTTKAKVSEAKATAGKKAEAEPVTNGHVEEPNKEASVVASPPPNRKSSLV